MQFWGIKCRNVKKMKADECSAYEEQTENTATCIAYLRQEALKESEEMRNKKFIHSPCFYILSEFTKVGKHEFFTVTTASMSLLWQVACFHLRAVSLALLPFMSIKSLTLVSSMTSLQVLKGCCHVTLKHSPKASHLHHKYHSTCFSSCEAFLGVETFSSG